MTEFQKKRLDYFIKAAKKCEYVQLAPGDLEILEIQKDLYDRVCKIHEDAYQEGYTNGWNDAYESYVESGKNGIKFEKI